MEGIQTLNTKSILVKAKLVAVSMTRRRTIRRSRRTISSTTLMISMSFEALKQISEFDGIGATLTKI